MSRPKSRWIPLESNPEVMSKYMHKLGMSKDWKFQDVYGLDPDLLATVPHPSVALLLLFPVTDNVKKANEEESRRITIDGQKVGSEVCFIKQTIGNACGTIGLLHSVLNVQNHVPLADPLKSFSDKITPMSPADRAVCLETDETLAMAHYDSAQEGQTEAPAAEENVECHFVAFVHSDGILYELDGSKDFPVNHGPSSVDTFLSDAARVCKSFMDRDPLLLRFTIIALVKDDA